MSAVMLGGESTDESFPKNVSHALQSTFHLRGGVRSWLRCQRVLRSTNRLQQTGAILSSLLIASRSLRASKPNSWLSYANPPSAEFLSSNWGAFRPLRPSHIRDDPLFERRLFMHPDGW